MTDENDDFDGSEIAIVGMALRVPGANNVDEYWDNLRNGVESVREFTDDELRAAGVTEAELAHPRYVRKGAPMDGVKNFDASFFGFSPRDAAIMDPQHRHFLEVSWEALEHAGYDPARYEGPIGVFGGSGHNVYMSYNLLTNPDLMDSVGFFLVRHTSNDKDFLVTRVSYLFDLTGPAVNVQTACSTSLVAVHMGVQSLLNRESDMVLAGGVTIDMPLDRGYVHEPGEILSRDGHCRAFDADSSGTIFGSGAGVVVLKRLDDALDDGDTIHSVVKGTAINNDGSNKVGYLAPSVDGQAAAVGEAIALAGVEADSIGYIECHGTGTEIGDPIEVAALTQAFGAHTDKSGFCALGSVKTNIGHLDTAAGVASLIKATLALKNKAIPPTVHFTEPNPKIGFENGPFFVNGELLDWAAGEHPRRAGVSSLGVGGTNAHIILEEAPEFEESDEPRPFELLPLSAKGPTTLDEVTANVGRFLTEEPDTNLADVAYTLQVGRQPLDKRRYAVVADAADAAAVLAGEHPKRILNGTTEAKDRPVVFMFPGQGAQFATMGRDLYTNEPVFAEAVDHCAAVLEPELNLDIRTLLFPEDGPDDAAREEADRRLAETALTQPAIFTIEYAMAQLWLSWGITPTAMIGHSIGEYVAACLSGVFSLTDALKVVAARGRLMQELPGGSMLAVPQSESVIDGYMSGRADVSLAARNGPQFCVVAGPDEAIDGLQAELEAADVGVRRLHTSHAFHSSMMDPMLDGLADVVAATTRNQPEIPYVSNVTGTWITQAQIEDPEYWATHVRSAVDFVGGLSTIVAGDPDQLLLEVGPGRTLSTFARQLDGPHVTVTSMRHPKSGGSGNNAAAEKTDPDGNDLAVALTSLGELWASGVPMDWDAFHGDRFRQRIALPTYPFQHQEFWVEPGARIHSGAATAGDLSKKSDIADWFYEPTWSQAPWPTPRQDGPAANGDAGGSDGSDGSDSSDGAENSDGSEEGTDRRSWLIFADDDGLGERLADVLAPRADATVIRRGTTFRVTDDGFVIDPSDPYQFRQLLRELGPERLPTGVAYLWPLTATDELDPATAEFEAAEAATFYGQLHLAQALGDELDGPVDWCVVTGHQHAIAGDTIVKPVQALALGPVKVIGQEFPQIDCRTIDIAWPVQGRLSPVVDGLAAELLAVPDPAEQIVAHRGHSRWVQNYGPVSGLDASQNVGAETPAPPITTGGSYLITGGTGGVGLELASHLATEATARLALVARTPTPDRDDWDRIVAERPENDPIARRVRRLAAMEAAGAEVLVLTADVTDEVQMKSAVAAAVDKFGTIDGVFHCAGQLADGLVTTKEQSEAAGVLAPKVAGTLILERSLAGVDVGFLALFSSISAIVGTAGQVDYASANAFLNAYAQQRNLTDDRRTVAIGWGPWSEVGMTVRTAVELGLMDDADRAVPVEHPVFDRWFQADERAGNDLFEASCSAATHWQLDEHRMQSGTPLLPGTGYIDIVRSAHGIKVGSADQPVELSDVFFMAPFMVPEDESASLRVTLESDGRFSVASTATAGMGTGATTEHATGSVRTLDTNGNSGDAGGPEVQDLDGIRSRCQDRLVTFERYEHGQLRWGPRWNNLRSIGYGADEALATLRLPEEFAADLTHHQLHPALLDLATAGAQDLITGFIADVDFFVPFSYGRLRQYRPLTAEIHSHIRYQPDGTAKPDSATFDISIVDGDGVVLATIDNFVMRRAAGDIADAAAADAPETAPAPLLDSLRNGISNAEGMDAIRRVLGGRRLPEVTVVAQDLRSLLQRAAEQSRAGGSEGSAGISHERPDLSTPYVEPTTEREIAIAGIWEEMLGVGNVGIHDDFYELGGHSLLLTQLSSRVKKLSTADIPLMALFEAATISDVAAAIDTAEAEQEASGGVSAPKLTAVSRSAYRVRAGSLNSGVAPGSGAGPSPGAGLSPAGKQNEKSEQE